MPVNNDLLKYKPMGRILGALTKQYFGALSKSLEHLGIDRHFYPLIVIDQTEEKCTQQYLSCMLDVDKVSMVRVMDYLMENGMITREVNSKDRREHLIKLTAKAKKILPEVYQGINKMNSLALKGLNKSEREQFYVMMSKMAKNIENLPVNEVDIQLKKK
ncbi:MAG TPA: MarR family transcriptional regulator [Bacteroidia bacterium]|jgi:DNA-binding MarR family transcriptional regulator|nr:MarR family transcriptional regulator [Bacteroidia bacterium]